MKLKINKITSLTAIFFMLLTVLSFGSYNSIEAGNNHHDDDDNCGTETYTFDHDGSNSKVEVDFESNDRQIDVSGRNGWSVTRVELDVEDDNRSGFWQYSTGPLNNFNPNPGNRINRARVTVTKQCPTSTPRNTPRPTPTATPTSTATATATPSVTPTSTPVATATPIATVSPTAVPTDDPCEVDCNEPTITPVPTTVPTNDVCENIDGIQYSVPEGKHLDASNKNCVEYSQAGAPEPKDSGIGGAEVLGVSTGQVLGVSTMAGTGAVEDAIFNSIFTLGSLLTSFGIMKNGKKVRN